jgi:hypothetical protein
MTVMCTVSPPHELNKISLANNLQLTFTALKIHDALPHPTSEYLISQQTTNMQVYSELQR